MHSVGIDPAWPTTAACAVLRLPLLVLTPCVPMPAQASTMQPQHVIAALKDLEFTELAEEIEAHQREWEASERPKGARPGFPLLILLNPRLRRTMRSPGVPLTR